MRGMWPYDNIRGGQGLVPGAGSWALGKPHKAQIRAGHSSSQASAGTSPGGLEGRARVKTSPAVAPLLLLRNLSQAAPPAPTPQFCFKEEAESVPPWQDLTSLCRAFTSVWQVQICRRMPAILILFFTQQVDLLAKQQGGKKVSQQVHGNECLLIKPTSQAGSAGNGNRLSWETTQNPLRPERGDSTEDKGAVGGSGDRGVETAFHGLRFPCVPLGVWRRSFAQDSERW